MSTLQSALTDAFANFETEGETAYCPEPTLSKEVNTKPVAFVGTAITLTFPRYIADDQFLVTGILRGIMGNLDYSRVNTIELFEDVERQAAQPGHGGEPRGLSEGQQIFIDNLETQLANIADVSNDVVNFWSEVNDNPNFSVHPRIDAQILASIQASKARKEEERLAKLQRMENAGVSHDLGDMAKRKAAILSRFSK